MQPPSELPSKPSIPANATPPTPEASMRVPGAGGQTEDALRQIYRFFSELSKLTIFAVFSLYALGFLIWHWYLGVFGISSIDFLQMDYLSAAFCYLILVAVFALPPALLCELVRSAFNKRPTQSGAILLILSLWGAGSTRLAPLYFPFSATRKYALHFLVGILALGIAHFVLVLHGRKYWSNSWVYKLLARREFVSIYLTVFVLQGFFSKQDVDNFFLLSTVGFYLGIVFVGGDHIQSIWSKSSAAIRLLLSTVILLALITHAQYFATKQFGKIPRAVGGGMPEKAFLKISDQNLQTFTLLAGATGGHAPLSGGFVGPVSILLRSEKDLFFMDYSMPSPIRLVTNIAGVRITNIVTRLTTNVQWISTPKVGSPSAPQVSTNVTSIVTTNFSTNFVSVPATFTAQKVRADLVDAIIFIR